MTTHTGTPRHSRNAASAGGAAQPLQNRPRDYHDWTSEDIAMHTAAHGREAMRPLAPDEYTGPWAHKPTKPERRAAPGAGIFGSFVVMVIFWIVVIGWWLA
jgi:hypothetical protein